MVAWLFSLHHLSEAELAEAATRIRDGERPDPSRALCETARVQMGAASLLNTADKCLDLPWLLALAAANLLLTPLAGFALWYGWRQERPAAAAQALRFTLPVAIALGALWIGMVAIRIIS